MIYCTFLFQVIGSNLVLFRIKQIITMTQTHLHWPGPLQRMVPTLRIGQPGDPRVAQQFGACLRLRA